MSIVGTRPAPRVSVIMPCYNTQQTIRRATDSVLGQTLRALELIIVDDGSTDGTRQIVTEIAKDEPRVRIILRERNGGPGIARNMGISEARGEWIAMIDSDDWYEPRRLQVLLDEAERDGAVVVADNQFIFRQGSSSSWSQLRRGTAGQVRHLTPVDLLKGDIYGVRRNMGLLKPMVKRQFLQDSKIRYDEEVGIGEDFYFLLRCARYASYLLFVEVPLYNYQARTGSYCSSPSVEMLKLGKIMHNRCDREFGKNIDPLISSLMHERGRHLDKVIKYKQLITPFKAHQFREAVKQLLSDPRAAQALFYMLVLHLRCNMLSSLGEWLQAAESRVRGWVGMRTLDHSEGL